MKLKSIITEIDPAVKSRMENDERDALKYKSAIQQWDNAKGFDTSNGSEYQKLRKKFGYSDMGARYRIIKNMRVIKEAETTFPNLSDWYRLDPNIVMTAIYWQQRKLPPSDRVKYRNAWMDIKKQLMNKYPPPSNVKIRDIREQSERADINLANQFAKMLGQKIKMYFEKTYDRYTPEMIALEMPKVKPGAKYIKIDAQRSGKFMLGPNNHLYFIKGYGVPDLKKDFGNIADIIKADFDYDGYSIVKKGSGAHSKYGYAGPIAESMNNLQSIPKITESNKFKLGSNADSDHCDECQGEEHAGNVGELKKFKTWDGPKNLCSSCYNKLVKSGDIRKEGMDARAGSASDVFTERINKLLNKENDNAGSK